MDISAVNNLAAHTGIAGEAIVPRAPDESQRALIQAVKAVNAAEMFGQDNELTFIVDRASRRAVVRIVNRQTRELVDQIPAEYLLRMAEELKRG